MLVKACSTVKKAQCKRTIIIFFPPSDSELTGIRTGRDLGDHPALPLN